MNDCIFSAHCTEQICDRACSVHAQTSYLLERNGIKSSSKAFKQNAQQFSYCVDELAAAKGRLGVVESAQTAAKAELLTYCAVCQNWRNSRLHCNVFHLKFSKFIEDTKRSWGDRGTNDDLDYTRIWSETANVLIISGVDFVNFNDFESQTLLNLLSTRNDPDLTTVVVSPRLDMLLGKGVFFARLKEVLREAVIRG